MKRIGPYKNNGQRASKLPDYRLKKQFLTVVRGIFTWAACRSRRRPVSG
jgi:hypothetical protein